MMIGGAGVAAVHTLHSEPVKRESVIGLLGNELFEHLAAGFLLVGHRSSRIIRGRETETKKVDSLQLEGNGRQGLTQRDAEGTEFAEKRTTREGVGTGMKRKKRSGRGA